jgi:cell division protein FtsN
MNELKNDNNLREAVSRRERQLPPMPADLNKRLMQRIEETEQARPDAKPHRLWIYAAVAVAASIALLIVFHFGKEQTPQEPLVAKHIVEKPVVSEPEPVEEQVPEQVEGEPVAEKPKSVKKQRKVVMQLVELIPTSEAKSDNVKSLPESLIANVKAYDKQSDLSRTTGIDDGTDAIVTTTMGMENTDPLVAMAAQMENIRQRGQRLQQEIEARMKN